MSLASLAILLLNGLASASSLFVVAAGLTLIFGVTRVVNFAHGSLYMAGAYIAFSVGAWLGTVHSAALGFWGGALAAARQHKHVEVGQFGVEALVRPSQDALDDEHRRPCLHRSAADLEDATAIDVLPIVQH